ncbi:MAG: hypothetical protein AB7G23_00720 [Vicinamibacterales bacterium]
MTINASLTQHTSFVIRAYRYEGGASSPSSAAGATPPAASSLAAADTGDAVRLSSPIGRSEPVVPTTYGRPAPTARAEALLQVLDADGNGTLTEQEFVEGAADLLRDARGARAHRAHHHGRGHRDDDGVRRAGQDDARATRHEGLGDTRRARRDERLRDTLTDLFARLDGNGDEGVDAGELTAALEQVASRRRGPQERSAPVEETAPVPDGSTTSASGAGAFGNATGAAGSTPAGAAAGVTAPLEQVSAEPDDSVTPPASDAGAQTIQPSSQNGPTTSFSFVSIAIRQYTTVSLTAQYGSQSLNTAA